MVTTVYCEAYKNRENKKIRTKRELRISLETDPDNVYLYGIYGPLGHGTIATLMDAGVSFIVFGRNWKMEIWRSLLDDKLRWK